ncbi:MAG: diacylglycerol kinase (ATP) [Kiritimatiellia bacterium]|jgi:diacylglycerol kinase (ATP)
MKLAVVCNPHARGIRRDPRLAERLSELVGDRGVCVVPQDLDELRSVVQGLCDDGVDLLALLGGDGTCSRVFTKLVPRWGDRPLPLVQLLRGGTMNTIAGSLGIRGQPEDLLRNAMAVADGEPCALVERNLLCVDGERYGFLFGNGLFANYIAAYDESRRGSSGAALVLSRAVMSVMVGGPFAERLTERVSATLEVDGELLPGDSWLVVGAGTVDDVGLGFRPFFGAVERPGKLHMIGIGCSPFELTFQLRNTVRGRSMRGRDVVDRVGECLVIRASRAQRYNLDGDLHPSGETTTVEVGPVLRFLVPGAPPRLGVFGSGRDSN